MVQWLADPTVHAQRTVRDGLPPKRPARRGYSVTDFQGDAMPEFIAALQAASISSSTTAPSPSPSSSTAHIPTEASIPENAVLRTTPQPPSAPLSTQTQQALVSSLRPQLKKKPPRRSYSATDKEPEDAALAPNQPRPAAHMSLLDLPPELHYTLYDFLDPIDAVCLGLAHSKLYAIHHRKNSSVPLSSRYNGPNDLEWVWRGVRHLGAGSSRSEQQQQQQQEKQEQQQKENALEKLRVKGQVYCRKCGISRCELHRHLKSWMGDGYEYCEIKERFGKPAPDGAKSYCFMSSPKDRNRCGRHGGLKASPSTTPATTPAATTRTAWM
ncbi:hypothetical protein LEL_04056 [Akanthomyces lecanii RCEF 1005]|uniref:F-box domain-containing protein n=1 Tax=Akanthomyces lecanii RCEF 1005 TaxID=1081108 RepID=A0A162K5L1_CORDF|nr:hypothetical protein LEL_04056 [Akanthomyces lecanii RCEF 1005]